MKSADPHNARTGYGYDVHRLVPGRRLVLGGVEIEWEKGLLGHSDGDVALHAIADALLEEAVTLDDGRPVDDISVVVLKVLKRRGDAVRRMTVRLPIDLMNS